VNIKNFRAGLLINLIGTLVVTAQAIVLSPIYIKGVGKELYGAWVVLADIFVALQFFDFGITSYSAQRIASLRGEGSTGAKQAANFLASLILVCISIASMSFVMLIGYHYIPLPSELTASERQVIADCAIIGAVAVGIQLFGYCFVAVSRALEDVFWVNIASLLGIVVGFAVALISVLNGMGIYSASWGMLVRAVIATLGSIVVLKGNKARFRISPLDRGELKFAFWDQVRRLPTTASGNFSVLAIASCENIIIGSVLGFKSVAVYSISRKLFDFVRTSVDIYSYNAYGGMAVAIASAADVERRRYMSNNLLAATAVIFFLCIGAYSINHQFVQIWVGEAMYFGFGPNVTLTFGVFLGCLSSFLFGMQRAAGRFSFATKVSLVELIVKVGAGLLFLRVFGIAGIGLAILLAAAIAIALNLSLTEIRYAMSSKWLKSAGFVATAVSFSVASELVGLAAPSMAMKLVVVGMCLIGLKHAYVMLRGSGRPFES